MNIYLQYLCIENIHSVVVKLKSTQNLELNKIMQLCIMQLDVIFKLRVAYFINVYLSVIVLNYHVVRKIKKCFALMIVIIIIIRNITRFSLDKTKDYITIIKK